MGNSPSHKLGQLRRVLARLDERMKDRQQEWEQKLEESMEELRGARNMDTMPLVRLVALHRAAITKCHEKRLEYAQLSVELQRIDAALEQAGIIDDMAVVMRGLEYSSTLLDDYTEQAERLDVLHHDINLQLDTAELTEDQVKQILAEAAPPPLPPTTAPSTAPAPEVEDVEMVLRDRFKALRS